MPNHADTLDFEGMPDLEDWSSEEITGEEPSVDTPSAKGPQPCLGSTLMLRSIRMRFNTGWQCSHGFDTCTSAGRRAGRRESMPVATTMTPSRFQERERENLSKEL